MSKLINSIQKTQAGITVALMRFGLGWMLFNEGAGKLWGWFHGPGIQTTLMMYDRLGVPFSPLHAYIVGYGEFISGVLLMLGLFTRLAVIPITLFTACAIAILMRISGAFHQNHLIELGVSLVILELGGGYLSLDHWMSRTSKE